MVICPADASDQAAIIALEEVIFEDMGLPLLEQYGRKKVAQIFMAVAANDPQSRYHYQRATVAKQDGQVLGVMFGYIAQEEDRLDVSLQSYLARQYDDHQLVFPDTETYPNEWYLDSLVVAETARDMGVGSQLLAASNEVAKQAGSALVGLNVDDQNQAAKRLYARVGFQEVGRLMIGSHYYAHMQRPSDLA